MFVIEANPRASRTVPFVAKATGVPLVKVAARVMLGRHARRAAGRGPAAATRSGGDHVAVKEAVLPFNRFPDADSRARPGDALDRRGHGHRPHLRPRVRQVASWPPATGCRRAARCSSRSPTATRPSALRAARTFVESGFQIAATSGTADHLEANGVPVATRVAKVGEEHAGRGRRRAAHRLRQGRPRRQLPARPRRPGRRRPHPPRRRRSTACPASPPRPPASPPPRASPTAPPTSSGSGRSRSTTGGSVTDRLDVAVGVGGAAVRRSLTASGTAGHGAELAAYGDLGRSARSW